jgi:nitrogen fixation/metabolism regulation signal transduction histidine kinase
MKKKAKRGAYFVHPSSQLKYIAMTIVPALLMSIFSIFLLFKSGEGLMRNEKMKLAQETASLHQTLKKLASPDLAIELNDKIEVMKRELFILQHTLEMKYYKDLVDWINTKVLLLTILPVILMCVGILALLYSHRIAGPLYRLEKHLYLLSDGKNTPPFHFRKYDEFKEVGVAFEQLRKKLEEKGYLK